MTEVSPGFELPTPTQVKALPSPCSIIRIPAGLPVAYSHGLACLKRKAKLKEENDLPRVTQQATRQIWGLKSRLSYDKTRAHSMTNQLPLNLSGRLWGPLPTSLETGPIFHEDQVRSNRRKCSVKPEGLEHQERHPSKMYLEAL